MKKMTSATIEATWDGAAYIAPIDCQGDGGSIRSVDGDEWTDSLDLPAEGPGFWAATICLIGGPRDGETVA